MQTKQEIIAWLEENRPEFIHISDEIWEHPEAGHREFLASQLQANYLAAQGFRITWGAGRLQTAFIAEWGQGKPGPGLRRRVRRPGQPFAKEPG